jgi:hypothetical protein
LWAKTLGLAAVMIAVDTWLGSSEHWLHPDYFSQMSFLSSYPALFHKFMSNVIRAEVSDHVLPIPIASLGAAEILTSLGVTANVIHLDAAHDYDSVTADLRAWWPLLAPGGGVFIGDDYPGWMSVQKSFDDFFGALGLSPLPIENDGINVECGSPAEAKIYNWQSRYGYGATESVKDHAFCGLRRAPGTIPGKLP